MALPSWAQQTVERIRPTIRIVRGSEIPDWSNPDILQIPGCSVQPANTSLSQDGRIQGITYGYTCYLPPAADVQAGDRIRFGGHDYTITGEPQVWQSPSGRVSNMQLNLERWSG